MLCQFTGRTLGFSALSLSGLLPASSEGVSLMLLEPVLCAPKAASLPVLGRGPEADGQSVRGRGSPGKEE